MKIFQYITLGAFCGLGMVACSDNMESEHYYTFTGEMMSDYITSRPQYSDFATIVRRANMMDLLSTYGHYTCFLPSNEAFDVYLQGRGKSSIDDLTDADCDTIARTHLVSNMYSTIEMMDGTLHTANMNRRYIQVEHGFDADSNSIVILNRSAQIYFALQDDSVENGIVQPIDMVLESSNSSIADVMKENPKISYFYQALEATGLKDSLMKIKDENYNNKDYEPYYYKSDFWHEIATVPDTKNYGFTLFVTPDSILREKYYIGVNGEANVLKDLYDLACELYDPVYPDDVNAEYHAFDLKYLTDRRNPLNRFVAYCIMTRLSSWSGLTPREMNQGKAQGAIGIKTNLMNPNDWYETLLPHTMVRIDQLTMDNYLGQGTKNEKYVNRRYDDKYQIEGAHIHQTVEREYNQDAPNGYYFYVDDVVAFTQDVQDKVQNCRIRMDFSTVFPEIMTNDIRLNGDPTQDDDSNVADPTFKFGRNYYFPEGYLDGVTSKGNCAFVYRRPHWHFWSYEGDEFNLFGDYDFTFRLPPVPFSGEWQVRLGFCALATRGVAQIYFDNIPQGIPLDMRRFLDSDYFMGSEFSLSYPSLSDEAKLEDQKALKNKGVYRGPYGGYHTDGNVIKEFVNNQRTYRLVLCQTNIDNTRDHYLRIRCTTKGKQGSNNNEFMMDYLELVPKSVYGVSNTGEMEDDL